MAKVWVLDTETKGTGANVVPLEKVQKKPEAGSAVPPPPAVSPRPRTERRPSPEPVKTAGPLPPGHVRKKTTGELGKVQAIDPKAGTATVFWLKQGRASTVPLASVSRR